MRITCAVLALALAGPSFAQEWKSPDKALRAAKKSIQPTLVVSESVKAADKDKPEEAPVAISTTLGKLIAADAQLKKLYADYRYAHVNCYSASHRSKGFLDPGRVEKWGKPVTLRVYAPGAEDPIFEKVLPPSADGNAQRAMLMEAVSSYKPTQDTLARIIKHYKAKNLKDRNLKKNAAAQVELARMWARAKSLVLAMAAYDLAINAYRKKKGGISKMKKYRKDKAALAVKMGKVAEGVKLYRVYLSKHKGTSDRGSVLLRICKLLWDSGNKSAAISQARSIKSDPTLKEQHADANEFLTGDPD